VAVTQPRDGRAGRIWFYFAALLLTIVQPRLRADATDQPGVDPFGQVGSNLIDEINAPTFTQTCSSLRADDIWTRSQLTRDSVGFRNELVENGVTFLGDITQYYQGVTSGGLAQQFKYGGRADYLVDVDSQKMGLWEGGQLDLRGETRLGQDTNFIDGTVAPSNFALKLPLPDQNVTALSGVQYTQELSKNVSAFFGKLNLLDGTPDAYSKGLRLNYFWNAAMQANLSRNFLFPSTLGAGVTVRDEDEPVFKFYLLDTHYTPTTSGFSTLFTNGVLAYGEYQIRTNWFDLPGHSAFGFLYSNATRTALDENPYLLLQLVLSGAPLPTKNSAWTATYRFDQIIYSDSDNPARHWILRGDYGLTDGDPNPVHWFANLSLVGNSPIRRRENDTIGVGYYHLSVSNLPIFRIHGLFAENGVEMFYNIAVTPWFHLTPDVQVLDPAQQHTSTALLVGMRARLTF
jgi:porin